ncbi:vitellogenin-like [Spodoptera litura]|uniref:Vitellogenin-like n=1 Tax=Spodoptera litura TaxID=69820 RepID=A0A9J7EUK3_SPOLT|nr:vitellogenin-like [Spodoptera litura]
MKLLVLTAIFAVVASNPLTGNAKWPWQVGKEYVYDVNTYTWTKFENSHSNGNAFKSQFVIRVQAPGHLLAKLHNPLHAQIQGVLDINEVPSDLKYEPISKIDEVFEILVDGGRVLSLKVPSSLSSANENILKGLISALQVDLSTFGHVNNFPNSFDKNTFQGLFKKSEADVTGDCETLYSISPISVEVRRNLQSFAEDPIEITKSKNYKSCKKRVGFAIGVPEGAIWNGLAYENDERPFIKHTSESRIHAGKQGTIYKSETLDTVFVNPLLFGKQKAEVYSYVGLVLASIEAVGNTEWPKPGKVRVVNSLLSSDDSEIFFKVTPEIIDNAHKVLQEITLLVQDPPNLSKDNLLSKFNVLVRFIMLMNSEQLTQMTDSIEDSKTSNNAEKNKMWIIYRDAVAQAGTIAAFKKIKSWIVTKKIQGEEAAEVIASVPGSLSFSNKEIMNEFLELALSPEVVEQRYLNSSALLAATKFIRSGNENQFVVEKVIPRLSAELKKAIEVDDSSRAQVYIRTLGNLAHPDILKVFAPYFEGQVTVTKYLRTQMVISLKTLANKKDEYVRAVLFSILRNTAEPYEVRVAAALNIFLAIPTSEMMQIMAHMTNDDPSVQVRGVIATSISFAANLKDPRFAQLAKTAQAVLSIVSKEKFGYRASADSIIDDYTSNDDLAHFRELSFIGSANDFFPKYHRTALRLRGTGLTEEDWITMSTSDVQDLSNYLQIPLRTNNFPTDSFVKFPAKKVATKLNITREHDPIEGAFFIDNLNQQRLFTFGQKDLNFLFSDVQEKVQRLINGDKYEYTKFINAKQVVVTFPLASGMPFVYKYSEPIFFNIKFQATSDFTYILALSLNQNINFTYLRNLDGKVGFLDTLSGVYAGSGVINKLQYFIPVNVTIKPKSTEITFEFYLPEKDINLIHMSVFPYTSLQKLHSALAVSEDPSTKVIKRSTTVLDTDINVGESAGVSLNLKGHSYSNDFKKNIFASDILTNVRNLLYQNDIACTHFDLKYVAKDTKNKKLTSTVLFETLFGHEGDDELKPAGHFTSLAGDSPNRRKKLADQVASKIKSAKVQIIDFSAVFDGHDKKEFLFTAALASSPVDKKSQFIVYAKGTEQINAVFKIVKPKVIPINFERALENDIKVQYEADFKYGNSENIIFKGIGERSKEYTERLSNDPLAKKCLQETSNKNFYQKDCHKMIIKAHAPDYFKGTVTYKDVNPVLLNATYRIYNIFKHFTTWEEDEDLLKATEDGKVEIEAQAFYYDNYINYKFNTKYGEFRMNNVEGRSYYPYAMAIYTPITNWERSYNWFTGYQYLPFCTVDDNKISTFSGRSYDYSLTGSWHVVMVDETGDSSNDLAILVKRSIENNTEVYVSYQNNKGIFLEIEITSKSVNVKSNGRKISDDGVITYYDDIYRIPLLEYYHVDAENYQVYSMHNGRIRLIYDGHRLVIFSGFYRSTTRGLCGQSTSQPSDDYMTSYGLVDLPEHYGASFSLEGADSDLKTEELKKESKLKAYKPVTQYTNILRSDDEWTKAMLH